MKKIIICTVLVSGIGVTQFFFSSQDAHSNGSGAPAARTGSPGDGANCSGCHTGQSLVTNQTLISSDIPTDGYIPGTTYNITATISKPGINKFGFQVSPQNASGQLKGTMTVTNSTRTQLISFGKYITHKTAGTAGTANSNTWDFQWTAPVAGTGALTFYGGFVAANNSGTSSGDQVFLSSLQVQENTLLDIAGQNSTKNWKLFPVPCTNSITLDIAEENAATISAAICSLEGKVIKQIEYKPGTGSTVTIETTELPAGMYVIAVKDKTGALVFHKKFTRL